MLTDAQRDWLARPEVAQMNTWTMLGAFVQAFGLTGEQAGACLAQWIAEYWDELPVSEPTEGYDERPYDRPYGRSHGPLDGCEPG